MSTLFLHSVCILNTNCMLIRFCKTLAQLQQYLQTMVWQSPLYLPVGSQRTHLYKGTSTRSIRQLTGHLVIMCILKMQTV